MVDRTYAEPPDALEYTIRRPADLGDLTRRMVRYQGRLMRLEQAVRLHRIRWSRGQVATDELKLQKLLAAEKE